jgi:hypothetical protein
MPKKNNRDKKKHNFTTGRFGPLIGMPNFEMPNLDSVNHCTSDFFTGTMVDHCTSDFLTGTMVDQ